MTRNSASRSSRPRSFGLAVLVTLTGCVAPLLLACADNSLGSTHAVSGLGAEASQVEAQHLMGQKTHALRVAPSLGEALG